MNNFLAITYAFMLGFCPVHQVGIGEPKEIYSNVTHVQFQIGVELFDSINIYAGEETFQKPYGNILMWFPYSQNYWLGAEYHKEFSKKMEISIGVNHECQHPLNCWDLQLSDYNYAKTELYVGVSGKFDVF